MREIKFRIWDKDSNKIYSQDDFILTFDTVGEDIYLSKNDKIIPLYRYNLMQYTGIKDKNGKEIYEGDIFISDNNNKYEVVFVDGGFKLSNIKYPNQNLGLLDRMVSNYGEVIGNIYENKDLLKK